MINLDETIDKLRESFVIIQKKKGFKYGIDSVLLSSFVNANNKDIILDLGTGCGIIPILLYLKGYRNKIVALDILKDYIEMLKRSLVLNNIDSILPVEADYNCIEKYIDKESIDVVVTNPPFFKKDSSLISPDYNKAVARHELKMDLDILLNAISYSLKDKGSLYMVYSTQRLQELFIKLESYNLYISEIRFIHPKKNEKSNIFLLKAYKNKKSNLLVDTSLIVYKNNKYTKEIHKIYNSLNMER